MRFSKTAGGGGGSDGGALAASCAPATAAERPPASSRIAVITTLNSILLLLMVRGKDHIAGSPATNLTEKSSASSSIFNKSFACTAFQEITAANRKRQRAVGRPLDGAAVNQCASSNVGSVETITGTSP